jgi:hypothetical protein
MPEALASHGVKTIVDSAAWRYREQPTFDVCNGDGPVRPASPLVERDDVRRFVEADLRSQCELGVDAYLISGFVPRDRNDDVSAMTLTAVETALAMSDLDPRPFIAFAGLHSERLDAGTEFLDAISRAVAGAYLQITPLQPQHDTVSKLLRCADFYAHGAADFSVIAGRGGGAGSFFGVLGATATDAGLAEGETFNFASKAQPKKPSEWMKGQGIRSADLSARSRPLDLREAEPNARRHAGSPSSTPGARCGAASSIRSIPSGRWSTRFGLGSPRRSRRRVRLLDRRSSAISTCCGGGWRRSTCEDTFTHCATHAWPPTLPAWGDWEQLSHPSI